MKKLIIILIGLLIVGSYAIHATSQAATSQAANKSLHKFRTIAGKIVTIDKKTRQITVRMGKTNEEEKFIVSAKAIKSLRINEEVMVKFKTGSNIAQYVKVIMKRKNIAKK